MSEYSRPSAAYAPSGNAPEAEAVKTYSDFAAPLCGIGDDCNTCLFSWLCPLCSLAQARKDLDGSPCMFNFCCLGHVPARCGSRTIYVSCTCGSLILKILMSTLQVANSNGIWHPW